MDKEEFFKALINEGYQCTIKNGIPTVHAKDKKVLDSVRKLVKSLSYNSSFGVVFDGGSVPGDALEKALKNDLAVNDTAEESVSYEKEAYGADTADTSPEPSKESVAVVNVPKEKPSVVSDMVEVYSQPSLFDMFDDLD